MILGKFGIKSLFMLDRGLAIKIDVDTDRGTREGVLPLARICQRQKMPATFLFSLGPDNTGKAIRRIFRPGFLNKVARTNVAGNYGFRTLLNGTLLPAPHIGRKNADLMRRVRDMGFEVGIHCYDHFEWQDYLHRMTLDQVRQEFGQAMDEFYRIFGDPAKTAGAPGWQCSGDSLQVYSEAELDYASDVRGYAPFLPRLNGREFDVPQYPTTLPTLDELLGREGFTGQSINGHYLALLSKGGDHVHTIHAEIEGCTYSSMFEAMLVQARESGVAFYSLGDRARSDMERSKSGRTPLPICDIEYGTIEGRSGKLSLQQTMAAYGE